MGEHSRVCCLVCWQSASDWGNQKHLCGHSESGDTTAQGEDWGNCQPTFRDSSDRKRWRIEHDGCEEEEEVWRFVLRITSSYYMRSRAKRDNFSSVDKTWIRVTYCVLLYLSLFFFFSSILFLILFLFLWRAQSVMMETDTRNIDVKCMRPRYWLHGP